MVAQLRMAEQDHGTRGTETGQRLRGEDHFSRISVLDRLSAAELKKLEDAGTEILVANPAPELPEEIDDDVAAEYLGDPADRAGLDEDGDVIELMTFSPSSGRIQVMTAAERDELESMMEAGIPLAHSYREVTELFGCGAGRFERTFEVVPDAACTSRGAPRRNYK